MVLFFLAVYPASSQHANIHVDKDFPTFIPVLPNAEEELDLTKYFSGFNLTFSGVPPKLQEITSGKPENPIKYKAISPMIQQNTFLKGAKAAFAALTDDNKVSLIQVKTEEGGEKTEVLFGLPTPIGNNVTDLVCFDIINAVVNQLWIDCQYKNGTDTVTNVIFRFTYGEDASKEDPGEEVKTPSAEITSPTSIRRLYVQENQRDLLIVPVYRFISSGDKFLIEKFDFVKSAKQTILDSNKTRDDLKNITAAFNPEYFFAIDDFIILIDKNQDVATGNFSHGTMNVTKLFEDKSIPIQSAKLSFFSSGIFALTITRGNSITSFTITDLNVEISNPITYHAVQAEEEYISVTHVGEFLVSLGKTKAEPNVLLTIHKDNSPNVYYHNKISHVEATDKVWLYPVGASHFIRIGEDITILYDISSQIALFTTATTLRQLDVTSKFNNEVLVRSFHYELYTFRPDEYGVVAKKTNPDIVNVQYPGSHKILGALLAYGPAVTLEITSKLDFVELLDSRNLLATMTSSPHLKTHLRGKVSFVEMKLVEITTNHSVYAVFTQATVGGELNLALCNLTTSAKTLVCNDKFSFSDMTSITSVNVEHWPWILVADKVIDTAQRVRIYHTNSLSQTPAYEVTKSESTGEMCKQFVGYKHIPETIDDADVVESFLCVGSNTVYQYTLDETNLTVNVSSFTKEDLGLDSIQSIRVSPLDYNTVLIKSKLNIYLSHNATVPIIDLSQKFTDEHAEFIAYQDKIVVFSIKDSQIVEYYIDSNYEVLEIRDVNLFTFKLAKFAGWDFNRGADIHFQVTDEKNNHFVIVYDFSEDPVYHPLRTIIPLLNGTNPTLGYTIKVADNHEFSVSLVLDQANPGSFFFRQVFASPTIVINSTLKSNDDIYNVGQILDFKATSLLPVPQGFQPTPPPPPFSVVLYITNTQRLVSYINGTDLKALETKPVSDKETCAEFNAHDLFKGTVLDLTAKGNGSTVSLKNRVEKPKPLTISVDSNITITTLGAKSLYVISQKIIYKKPISNGIVTDVAPTTFSIEAEGDWTQARVNKNESHVLLLAKPHNSLHNSTLMSVSLETKTSKSISLPNKNRTIALSDNDILFTVASPDLKSESFEDAFITCYYAQTLNLIKVITFGEIKNVLDLNSSVIQAVEVFHKGETKYDLIILDRDQGLILCHTDLSDKASTISCAPPNITKINEAVKEDINGVTPVWTFLKLIKTTKTDTTEVYKIIVGASNYHSYLVQLTHISEDGWNVDILKGFVSYFPYSQTSQMTANELHIAAVLDLPQTNLEKSSGQFIFLYDVDRNDSNVIWNRTTHPLVDAFQRLRISNEYGDPTVSLDISENSNTLYSVHHSDKTLFNYEIKHNHSLCVVDASKVNSLADFTITASNDFSFDTYTDKIGVKWEDHTPPPSKFWKVFWILVGITIAIGGVYILVRFIKKRREGSGANLLGDQESNGSTYREL